MLTRNRLFLVMVFMLAAGVPANAHCDGWDGPVVKAGQQALETGNVNLALIWVSAAEENDIRSLFQKVVRVRKAGPEAKELAETYFLETLVRLHRAGEGEAYTGLKAPGRDLGPIIPAYDRAVESEQGDQKLAGLFEAAQRPGILEKVRAVRAARRFEPDDVPAGREFVRQYVALLHHLLELQPGSSTEEHHQHHAH
ncbi:MAG: DUF6448 family protein [Acidobacteriota bacterium]